VRFSPELREGVAGGDITLSVRLWQRPKVRGGGRYESDGFQIEIDSVEVLPFSAVTAEDVSRSGESDRGALRQRAAHARPIDDDTWVQRNEFHVVQRLSRHWLQARARQAACESRRTVMAPLGHRRRCPRACQSAYSNGI